MFTCLRHFRKQMNVNRQSSIEKFKEYVQTINK